MRFNELCQVEWTKAMETLEHQKQKFIFNALTDWQPVKIGEYWGDVIATFLKGDQASSSILKALDTIYLVGWKICQQTVTRIDARGDEGMDKFFCAWFIKVTADLSQQVDACPTRSQNARDVGYGK